MDKSIKDKLIELADEEYRKFNSGLIPSAGNILGVRMPLLHKMAREIAKGNWRAYIAAADDEYFEETMLQGLVIGYVKADVEEILKYIAWFVPKINNWAVCEIFDFNNVHGWSPPDYTDLYPGSGTTFAVPYPQVQNITSQAWLQTFLTCLIIRDAVLRD